MKQRTNKYFACDFETTVYDGQQYTEVWAAGCAELFTEDVNIFHSIDEQFDYFVSLNSNVVAYYHNLKFDGSFWLPFLMLKKGYNQAINNINDKGDIEFLSPKEMPDKSFTYSISSMGQWYKIIIKDNRKIIELRDSLKLLPFSLKKIGADFETKHKKLEMEYKGLRYAGCDITPEEKEYFLNDIFVLKEALEIMFTEGHTKLTIGSCCLAEYKNTLGRKTYDKYYPNVYTMPLDSSYCATNVGEYVKQSYHGGWCYLVKGKENKLYKHGVTADVNSLYPSVMSSESGCFYPIGEPTFFKGTIPETALDGAHYYFVRFRCRFYLKPGKLPFIQIKHSFLYKATEMLETSDIYDPRTGKYYDHTVDEHGNKIPATVTLTMTMTDYALFKEHYDTVDFELLDGCYFNAAIGIFDKYIEKYKHIKVTSKGAKRNLAKLFLNNLYGKMAASPVSNFKVAYIKPDTTIGYYVQESNDKIPGYIPVGSAITSYARNFTIRAAQKNYYGSDKDGFIYADTDSIHCSLSPDQLKGVETHATDFCKWKLESSWDEALFIRQKTYIEHVYEEDLDPVETPYYQIKCAGMPKKCKELFLMSTQETIDEAVLAKLTEEEKDFLKTKRKITDFKVGLRVPGKLIPKQISGGTILVDTTYEIR